MKPDLYFKGLMVQEDWFVAQRHGRRDERKVRETEGRKEGRKMEER